MVRHGQAQNNIERRLAGRMDGIMLTPDGIAQAQQAARMLCSAGISAIYSSPISRAVETARIISEKCQIKMGIDERLTEIDMGKFTGMKFEEIVSSHGDIFTKFYEGDVEIAHNGVETFEQVRRRVFDIMSDVTSNDADGNVEDGSIVLVTHMDPIKAMLGEVTGISPEKLLHIEIKNASLNVFDASDDDTLSLMAFNVMDASRFAV